MSLHNILLKPYKLNNSLTLKNRIVMAPMTRAKATGDLIPTIEMANYYARRSAAGLIITEGTVIAANALGHKNVPGIFSVEQIKNWKIVAQKIHQNNGIAFLQLWHVGRVSHPSLLNGELPLSASETTMVGKLNRSNDLTLGKSRAATIEEIKSLVNAYKNAALNARKAGFDGIEVHGANGYLIDQFLHYETNTRSDEYGQTPENMARFALEIIEACGEAIGYDRVAIRVSPGGYLNEIKGIKADADVFKYLLAKLNQYPIAYVHTGNFNDSQQFEELNDMTMSEFIRRNYGGVLVGCGSYTIEAGIKHIQNNDFDLLALGRPFIANPDLIHKIEMKKTLTPYNVSMLETLY